MRPSMPLCTVLAALLVALPLSSGSAKDFIRGDSNQDAFIDIADSVFTLFFLFLSGAPPECMDASDADDDGVVRINDPIFTLNYLFLSGRRPPAPFPSPGGDPTADDLRCPPEGPGETATIRVTIELPRNLLVTGESQIDVQGIVEHESLSPAELSVKVNGIFATVAPDTGVYTARVRLREGLNTVSVVAVDPTGESAAASVSVFLDTNPPSLAVEDPLDGLVTDSPAITVTGLLNDVGSSPTGVDPGTVLVRSETDEAAPRPIVDDVEATLDGKSFVLVDLPLRPGVNVIHVTGIDGAGNISRTVTRRVTRRALTGQRIERISGDGQASTIGQELARPLVVALRGADGTPVGGRTVRFEVVRDSGLLAPLPRFDPGQKSRVIFVTTDAFGNASAYLTLGTRVGAGLNRVRATAAGFGGEALFCSTALAGPPAKILASGGANQTGVAGTPLADALVALAVDQEGNPVARLPITFRVIRGSGTVAPAGTSDPGGTALVVETNGEGHAAAIFRLGAEVGDGEHVAVATFEGQPGLAATYLASARRPGLLEDTALVGIVLDAVDRPVEGVTASVVGPGMQDVTDADGRFRITNVPVGTVFLRINGTTTTRPGTWPTLEFQTTTIAGVDNDLGGPIRLPEIAGENRFLVGGDEDVVVTMDDVPGMSITVLANSATFLDGSRTGEISLTQVKLDKVPMPPPNGSIFMPPAWSIQPPGVRFDPPARVTIPNDGMAPGAVIDIFQFDHDLEMFVNVGTGTTTDDGAFIISDPGFGIVKSGWGGCGGPPPPTTCASSCGPCQRCEDGVCVPDTGKNGQSCDGSECGKCNDGACDPSAGDGTPCDDGDFCTDDDQCRGGTCKGKEDPPETVDQISYKISLGGEPVGKAFFKILGSVPGVSLSKPPELSISIGCQLERECCKEKMDHVISHSCTLQGTISVGEAGLKILLPPPAPPLSFIVGSIGLSGSLSGQIKKNECKECTELSGSGGLAIPISAALQWGPDAASIQFLVIESGASGKLELKPDCKNAQICATVQFDGMKVKSQITLGNSQIVLFEIQAMDPAPLGSPICGPFPLDF